MYLGRFYEFKQRLKNYFDALKAVTPENLRVDVGDVIGKFNKTFAWELRERNQVHHSSKFVDLALDRVSITNQLAEINHSEWQSKHRAAYKKFAKDWVNRVRLRADDLDKFLEATAEATLKVCDFLPSQQKGRRSNR